MKKVAAIVVTHNRKELLCTCLESIRRQTLAPDAIYIVDNHSEIDTAETLLSNHYISSLPDTFASHDSVISHHILSLDGKTNIRIVYIYKHLNDGGAGGFYAGMKVAYHDEYEWLWMMDDDGIPAENGLDHLLTGAYTYNLDYANALVVNINDKYTLSFGWERVKKTIADYTGVDIVRNAANPFNGTLINRKIPEKIGFVKKEMFLLGDEMEYLYRSLKNGFSVATIVKSIHYHPPEKGKVVLVFPGCRRFPILIYENSRGAIYYRNLGYIEYTYKTTWEVWKTFIKYSIFFLSRLRLREYGIFCRSFINGCRNRFDK
ncbi:MAG: glycosyltransferase [Tannerellaceae bacterium]|jgi:GT2 family glycosyltransferase|nr:glycosyltransferase [Tannerellaceae bacterium]